ncbi:MAG: hypothetical protein Q7V14_05615, partial [Coriobacteriia bacterium]|nr:hypothetical protein [Coriobacteriia bacterium]
YSYCFGDPVNRWDPTGADSPKDGPYDAPVWYNDAYSDAISRGASPDDAIRAGETAAAAAEAMRRAFLTPEQRALEDMRAAANRAAVSAAWASMSSGPLVNRASPERFMPGRASPGGFSSIVNVNGPGGMREMGQRFASIPTTSFALVGYGAFHGVLAVGCFIAATGAVTATTVTVPFTGGLSMAGGVPIAAGLYAAAALNATSALGLTLAGVYTAKHGM